MKKNVLIVNGSEAQTKKLQKLALEINKNLKIYMVKTVGAAQEIIMSITIDIFIIDTVLGIDVPGDTSGIRLAEQIREINKYVLTPLIFITSEKDPDMYAYTELNCLGYFVRPYREERLKAALEKAMFFRTERNEDKALFFRKGGVIYPVKIKDIVYIESVARNMLVHTSDGSEIEVLYKTYNTILLEADSEYLIQCSRGVVINKKYIFGIDLPNRFILLKNNLGKVDIGTTYRKKIIEEFGDANGLFDFELS